MTIRGEMQVEDVTDLVAIVEDLGLYQAMSETPLTVDELARITDTPTRFVSDWLATQAEEGYVNYDAITDRYANWCSLPRAA